MISGYLCKRNSPISPPQMQRMYCVLWGTLLLDYENEEDSKTSLSIKSATELIGVSDWDGQGRVNKYPNGFLAVSHTGTTYYMSAMTIAERDDWVLHIKTALECNFANTDLLQFKPSKAIHKPPELRRNLTCQRTGQPFISVQPICCKCCGYNYLPEHVQESIPILQLSIEELEKMCLNCRNTQLVIIWLKSLNYMHAMSLHESSTIVLQLISKFKSSFKLRRTKSARLDMAAKMYEEKLINQEEFEELRKVDKNFQREWALEESARLKEALDVIDNDIHTVIGMLMNPSATDSGNGSIRCYYELVRKVLELAEHSVDLVDFYWPQIMHTHLRISKQLTISSLSRIDLLQQCILVLSVRYPQLAVKTAWSLIAIFTDFNDKKVTATQFAASMSLYLSLQALLIGTVPCLATEQDDFGVLSKSLFAALHQKIELRVELRILFRCRRKLLEVQDLELKQSKQDKLARVPSCKVVERSSSGVLSGINAMTDNSSNNSVSGKYTRIRGISLGDNPFGRLKESYDLFDSADELNKGSTALLPPTVSTPVAPVPALLMLQSSSFSTSISGLATVPATGAAIVRTAASTSTSLLQLMREIGLEEQNEFSVGSEYVIAAPSCLFSRHFIRNQLDWLDTMTEIVEKLRFVDRPLRTERLREEIAKLNNFPNLLGYDPTSAAGEPRYRVSKIIPESCRVFRTKARAPSLIVCEVILMDDEIETVNHSLSDLKTDDNDKEASQVGSVTKYVAGGSSGIHHHLHVNTNVATQAILMSPPHARVIPLNSGSGHSMNNSGSGHSSSTTPKSPRSGEKTLDLEGMEYLLESGVKQALEAIQRRDSHDRLLTPGDSYSTVNSSATSTTHTHTPVFTAKVPTRSHSDESMNSSSHSPLTKVRRNVGREESRSLDRLTSLDSHSVILQNSPQVTIKSSKLAAHRKSGSHFAIQAASGSGSTTGTFEGMSANVLSTVSTSGRPPLPRPLQIDLSRVQFGSSDADSESPGVPEELNAAIRQHATLSDDNVTLTPISDGEDNFEAGDADPSSVAMSLFGGNGDSHQQDSILMRDYKDTESYSESHAFDCNDKMEATTVLVTAGKSSDDEKEISTPESEKNDSDWTDVFPPETEVASLPTNNIHNFGVLSNSASLSDSDLNQYNTDGMTQPNVLLSAKSLLESGAITEAEYRLLLKSDAKYRELSMREESSISASRLQKCFGESWSDMKLRVLGTSSTLGSGYGHGEVKSDLDGSRLQGRAAGDQEDEETDNHGLNDDRTSAIGGDVSESDSIDNNTAPIALQRWPVRDLRCFIVKSNDDLRQEMCCMQLLELCLEIFNDVGLSNLLWLKTYRIVSTSANTGILQVLPDTLSIDALKKTEDFVSLPKYYERVYGTSPERLRAARKNFVMSFAAYSLVCYILQIKDRHNGNILMDRDGHIIHIDFGFLLGIAPGGSFSLETAPFKFTEEMVDIIGGLDSPMFAEMVRAFTTGFIALQANAENIVSTLEMLAVDSPFPCFVGKDRAQILEKLRGRFRTDLNVTETVHHCMDLITLSYGHLGTRQYDTFQWFTNGIIP